MKPRWFPILVAILGLALFSSLSVPVAAATPAVDLVLGGSGATPWTIGNIAPGNSGTKTVTLSNTGSENGVVTIWISNIVNSEGVNLEPETGNTAEPGELGNYLTLNVSGPNLNTNITLPAKINDFPQSAGDARHIYVSPLNAGSTLTLQWDWRLPPATGNDVQGDFLSFTINYVLEESPPPTPPPPGDGGGVPPGASTPVSATPSGPGPTLMLISCADSVLKGSVVDYIIQVTNRSEKMDLHNLTIVGLIPAEMAFVSAEGPTSFTMVAREIRFSPLVAMPPGQTVEFYIKVKAIAAGTALFNATMRWDESGEAIIAQTSITVLNLGTPTPPSLSSPEFFQPLPWPPETVPANFEVYNLTISPVQAICGESISINCVVVNTGGQCGEYKLLVNIPGLLQTSRLIKLEAGQAQAVSFALMAGSPGTYQVDIGGINDTFTIGVLSLALPAPPVLSNTQIFTHAWLIPLIIVIIAVAGLIYYAFVVLMRRRHYRQIRQGRRL